MKKKNRSAKFQVAAKPEQSGPAGGEAPPLPTLKRGRGRPRKVVVEDKALAVFKKVVADQELLISEPEFDGGGTKSDSPVITKESLERRVARRLNVLDRYLTDDRLLEMLSRCGLKEVGIYEGIMMDKSLLLKGQPTVIIGNEDRKAMDEVMPRLLTELKKRGLITSVSERKIEFKNT
jgi:hypothetical protein